MDNVIIKRKEVDGSYSDSQYLFDAVDLYSGDTVKSILELSPVNNAVKNVKILVLFNKNKINYQLKPKVDGDYELVTDRYKGLSIWFADKNGIKYRPDKNGVISVTNLLSIPLDIQIWLKADKYTIENINETVVLDDVLLRILSQDV